jgi:hypothetical protein
MEMSRHQAINSLLVGSGCEFHIYLVRIKIFWSSFEWMKLENGLVLLCEYMHEM